MLDATPTTAFACPDLTTRGVQPVPSRLDAIRGQQLTDAKVGSTASPSVTPSTPHNSVGYREQVHEQMSGVPCRSRVTPASAATAPTKALRGVGCVITA